MTKIIDPEGVDSETSYPYANAAFKIAAKLVRS